MKKIISIIILLVISVTCININILGFNNKVLATVDTDRQKSMVNRMNAYKDTINKLSNYNFDSMDVNKLQNIQNMLLDYMSCANDYYQTYGAIYDTTTYTNAQHFQTLVNNAINNKGNSSANSTTNPQGNGVTTTTPTTTPQGSGTPSTTTPTTTPQGSGTPSTTTPTTVPQGSGTPAPSTTTTNPPGSGGTTTTQPNNTKKDDKDSTHTLGEIITEGDSFIFKGSKTNKIKEDNLKKMSNTLYNILLVLGIIIAIVIGLVLGVKFITEGVEGRAEVSKALVPYIVGCVIVFGAFIIWKVVVDILQSM